MRKIDLDKITFDTANECSIQLLFAISEKYEITLDRAIRLLDEINYYRVINDDELCCLLAHDAVDSILKEIEEKINVVLSWTSKQVRNVDISKSKEIPFESQSITLVEHLIKDEKMTREQAIKLWFNSETYKEIIKRIITYISAMKALFELERELTNHPEWMKNID